MDALYRLLVEQYGMDPDKAKQYTEQIHKERSNPDNLQTEAYTKAVGKKEDYDRASQMDDGQNPDNVQANMGRLAQRAKLFAKLHEQVQAGKPIDDPKWKNFYDQVINLHKEKVRANADKALAERRGAPPPSPTEGLSREQQAMRMYEPRPQAPRPAPQGPSMGTALNVGAYHAGEGGGLNAKPNPPPVDTSGVQFPMEREQYSDLYLRFLNTPEPTFYQPVDLPMMSSPAPEPFRQAAQNAYTKGRR